jgi:hypothetical protein
LCSHDSTTQRIQRLVLEDAQAIIHRFAQVHAFGRQLQFADLDLGHVEHVGDEVEQILAGIVDQAGIFGIARIAQRAE